jgi:hypothetical protein
MGTRKSIYTRHKGIQIVRNLIMTALLILFSMVSLAEAENDVFDVETEGYYRIEAGTSVDLAKKVALFTAKKKAIESAGKYLSRNSLIEIYELDKDEIYSLAAREIPVKILAEIRETAGADPVYRLRIRARIKASDFIKAEMEDTTLTKKEAKASYQEKMEQPISAKIDPGKDIAKAYRLLRERKWRIAMIYLNHLEKKYPAWDSVYMAKALTHYILHEPIFMKKALNEACRLGNQMACDDLKNLKKVHQQDFDLSIVE